VINSELINFLRDQLK